MLISITWLSQRCEEISFYCLLEKFTLSSDHIQLQAKEGHFSIESYSVMDKYQILKTQFLCWWTLKMPQCYRHCSNEFGNAGISLVHWYQLFKGVTHRSDWTVRQLTPFSVCWGTSVLFPYTTGGVWGRMTSFTLHPAHLRYHLSFLE